jgi:hypothetical protein
MSPKNFGCASADADTQKIVDVQKAGRRPPGLADKELRNLSFTFSHQAHGVRSQGTAHNSCRLLRHHRINPF